MVNTKTSSKRGTSRDGFIKAYKPDLVLGDRGQLIAKNGLVFFQENYRDDVATPTNFPYVQYQDTIYFLIPGSAEFPETRRRDCIINYLGPTVVEEGRYHLPAEDDDWTNSNKITSEQIVDAIKAYRWHVEEAHSLEQAKALLEDEAGNPEFYASCAPIDEVKPMMVQDFMLDQGVSVIFGPMDEFKSTLATDLAAHVSVGAMWRGRTVKARPVIVYALEGKQGLDARLKALEARLLGKETPWGNHKLPITVRERIPTDPRQWRLEIAKVIAFWEKMLSARERVGDLPCEKHTYRDGVQCDIPLYPDVGDNLRPLIVIDQFSLALNGEDEKGHKAVAFVRNCLDLVVWNEELAEGDPDFPTWPVASHVMLLAHPTKSGDDIAGHRALSSDTHMLYRIQRPGRLGDAERPMVGILKPLRTKDMPLPSPMRFEVEIVAVPGTQQNTTMLKDAAPEVPEELLPAIKALRQLDEGAEISGRELNDCLDAVIGDKEGGALRKARERAKNKLIAAGAIDPVTDNDGRLMFYRFQDSGVA